MSGHININIEQSHGLIIINNGQQFINPITYSNPNIQFDNTKTNDLNQITNNKPTAKSKTKSDMIISQSFTHLDVFIHFAINKRYITIREIDYNKQTIYFDVAFFQEYCAESGNLFDQSNAHIFPPMRLFILNKWLINLDATRTYQSVFSMSLRSDYFVQVINKLKECVQTNNLTIVDTIV